ncbi:MAG: LCP family protein [Patescibacteria group bacterium]|jgi:LCP family protein required for cell wall assembly
MIDFKQKIEEEEKKQKKFGNQNEEDLLISQKSKRITTYSIAVIVLALIFAGRVMMSSLNATNWFTTGIFNNFKHLIPVADKKMNGEELDHINILLLGVGGEGHDGAYLTDTIILASLKPSTKQVSLVSIPRDLVTPVSNWEKINSINAYAETKNPGSGGPVTTQAISTLLQIPIQYYVRVDFNGFINIIDKLGGIEVNVENTLDDYSYPILSQEDNPNYFARYEHLHIKKGLQTMNGSLALKYARSRHAAGIEGSDFARARRQQLVLEAVKNKLFSAQTLLNPIMIAKLINEFNKNISTNLSVWEILRVWDLFKDVDRSQMTTKVLSDAPDNLLISGRGQGGAYILMPRSGNFSDIRNLVQNAFSSGTTTPALTTPVHIPITITDQASVSILNGTWISGLASKHATLLEQAKFNILKIANAPIRNYTQTIVYDLSNGNKKSSLKALEKITGAVESSSWPVWLTEYSTNKTTLATSSTTASATDSPITTNLTTTTTIDLSTTTPATSETSTATVLPYANPDFLIILGTDANEDK